MPGPSRSNRQSRIGISTPDTTGQLPSNQSSFPSGGAVKRVLGSERAQRFGKAAGKAAAQSADADSDRERSNSEFAAKHADAGRIDSGFKGFGVLQRD